MKVSNWLGHSTFELKLDILWRLGSEADGGVAY